MNYLAIFVGGGIGSLLRFITTLVFNKYRILNMPLGTFFSNIFASLILGLLVGFFLTKKIENELIRNLLIIGVCGGFSTFSTFSHESLLQIQQSQFFSGFIYMSMSVLVSVLVIYIGIQASMYFFSN